MAEYCAELFSSGATFGPSTKLAEIWSARNLGWSRYDRMPGPAFLTLYQGDPLLSFFTPLTTHVRITRIDPSSTVEVYNGVYVEPSSAGDDVVLNCVDYLGLFGVSRADFQKLYPSKKLGTEIAQVEVDAAIAATSSVVGFITRGTIEDPLGSDGVTVIKTNAQFGTLMQMRLQLLYDLSEMGRANTGNQVTFGVSRTSPFTFTFNKNKGTSSGVGLVLNGNVSDYEYVPGWRHYRNDLATIGSGSGGGAAAIVKQNAAEITAKGLRQDVFSIRTVLGIAGAATEADQQQAVAQRALKLAVTPSDAIAVRLLNGTIVPFQGWDICDKMTLEVSNGLDAISGEWRLVGYREVISEAGEHPTALVAPVLT